jgi:ribA/ribD-fused uncharacterized protein
VKDKFGAFSNMRPGYPMRISQIDVPSTEAFYEAMRFPHLPDFQKEILDQEKPVLAKRHAYTRVKETREDWFKVNTRIMRQALELRCAFYPEDMRRLMDETQGRPIVEISRRDDFWGTFERNGLLQGKNILGRLWMERRELHLQTTPGDSIKVVAPRYRNAQLCGCLVGDFTPEPNHPAQPDFNF